MRTKRGKIIEEYLKNELNTLEKYHAYGVYHGNTKGGIFYEIFGVGYEVTFYICNSPVRLCAGCESFEITYYDFRSVIPFSCMVEELEIIDKIRGKLDVFIKKEVIDHESL